ncbi:Uncharacterized protein Fot_18700 [Forsythia ovata]|uniref:DUF7705 domain-containing protein n=1 Tax=Forsythia ovata TaxID=205694 RepID=A0ABD1VIY2_9LAMI
MTQLTSPMVPTTITLFQVMHSTCRNHTAAAILTVIRKHNNWFSCCFIQYGQNMDTGLNRERVGLEMGELGNSMSVDFPVDFTSTRYVIYKLYTSVIKLKKMNGYDFIPLLDLGTIPARRIWTSLDVGIEIFVTDKAEVVEWTLCNFDVILT